jgi:hypothetical protein
MEGYFCSSVPISHYYMHALLTIKPQTCIGISISYLRGQNWYRFLAMPVKKILEPFPYREETESSVNKLLSD